MREGGLRRRVMLASAWLGLCLSVVFGAAMVFVAEAYEHILVEEIVRGQAEDYALRVREHGELTLPRSRHLSGWLRRPGGGGGVPARYAAIGPGIHELEDGDAEGLHVGVFDTAQGRFFFAFDLGGIERLERLLAAALVVILGLGTALAAWLGWLSAGTTIAPVTRLAAAVDALPVEPRATALAEDLADDELRRLAQAIDAYQQRLVDADAAERAFFADASHELRTPVAVVRGAVELLAEEAGDAGMQRRVRRLERGVAELGDLLELLFALVRRREPDTTRVDAGALLRDVAIDFFSTHEPGTAPASGGVHAAAEPWHARDAAPAGPAASRSRRAATGEVSALVRIEIDARGAPPLPARETALLARGILRRRVPPGAAGVLHLRADAGGLELAFAPDDAEAASAAGERPARSDRGLGLTLAGRFAAQLGWRIEEDGATVRVKFATHA